MRLIELRLKNLNSLKGEWHIDFTDPAFVNEGIFAITGQTGAGKTTILDAICLALYSQTPRLGEITGASNEMMTQGTGECSAEVEIEIGGTHYRCVWYQHRAYKKSKGKLSAIKHEISDAKTGVILEDAKSKTTPYIQNLIGMDFKQFTRSIMLAQGSFAAFLKSDVGDRAAILEKITGTAIYARISKNVFEKKRDEESELAKLQAGVDSLPLLSLEDERQLRADLESHQSTQVLQQQAHKNLSNQIQWLDKVTDLKQQLAHYQTAMLDAKQNKQAFTADAARLEAADKALEIDRPYQELTYSRNMAKRLEEEQQNLLDKTAAQQALLDTATIDLQAATTHETQAANELHNSLPILAKVRALDTQIQQQAHALVDDHQRQDSLSASIQRYTQEFNTHKTAKDDTEHQLASIAHYLSTHSELNDIDADIALFNSHCTRLKYLLQDNLKLNDNKLTYQQTASQLQQDMATLTHQQQADQQRIGQQQDALQRLKQQQADLLQDATTTDMRAQLEHFDESDRQLQSMHFKLQQLTGIASQVTTISNALPTIKQELTVLDDLISDNELDINHTKEQRQDKQAYLEALQKVAKLEDYITELQEDSPCPLCGATEHPYREHHPLLNPLLGDNNDHELSATEHTRQQINELDAALNDLASTLSKRQFDSATIQNQLKNEHLKLAPLREQSKSLWADIHSANHALVSLDADFIQSSQSLSFISQDSQSVSQQLEALADINANIDIADDKRLSALLTIIASAQQRLTQQKEDIKSTLNQYDDAAQALSSLTQTIATDEKTQQQYINDYHHFTTESKLTTQQIAGLEHTLTTNFVELATVMTAILEVVNRYPAGKYQNSLDNINTNTNTSNNISNELSVDSALQVALKPLLNSIHQPTVLDEQQIDEHMNRLRQLSVLLTQLKKEFHAQKETQHTLANTLSGLLSQIESTQLQLQAHDSDFNALAQHITDKTRAIEQLHEDRTNIATAFVDKQADSEENRLRTALGTAQTAQHNQQRQHDSAKQMLQQLQDRAQQLSAEHAAATAMLDSQNNNFAALLAQSQFATEADFINARLPKEERESLKQRHASIEQALNHASNQLDSTQHLLTAQLASPLTSQQRDTLASQQRQLQAEIDQRNGELGAINQQLKANQQQKSAQSAQNIAIAAQKEKLQVWQHLYLLIGSADGKKFRTFAQGLTFQVMIGHANAQLQKMSDRYLLTHDDSNPLELNVIDNYQGGDIRSTKNLSGGEGFIISLALALGLSQMASQNIRVDSLFLDEGFGTLDEESLDIALDTLTSLQQEGKLIGIISHVQALKERILTQIQVKKIAGGFSEITGQGCYEIAS